MADETLQIVSSARLFARPSQRIDWLDATKGILIILVVFGHTWRGLALSGIMPHGLFSAIDDRIYAFHIPAFFAVSGWLFTSTLEKSSTPSFLWSRWSRLLWPMVLWTYIFLGVKFLAGSNVNTPITTVDLAVIPIPGILHMWFIWALLLITTVLYALKPFTQGGKSAPAAIWIAVVVVLLLQFMKLGPEASRWAGGAIEGAPFFLLGLILGQRQLLDQMSAPIQMAAAALFAVLVAAWPIFADTGMALPAALVLCVCVLAICSGFSAICGPGLAGVLCFLGAASLPIFLTHTIFSASLRELLFVLEVRGLAAHVLLGTLAGIVGPLVLLTLARLTGTSRLLGLGSR